MVTAETEANEDSSRARIFKLLRSPRIDSKEPIPPAYVAELQFLNMLWRLGTD